MLEKIAPIGYEDETGFHYGVNSQAQPDQFASPTIDSPSRPRGSPAVIRSGREPILPLHISD